MEVQQISGKNSPILMGPDPMGEGTGYYERAVIGAPNRMLFMFHNFSFAGIQMQEPDCSSMICFTWL